MVDAPSNETVDPCADICRTNPECTWFSRAVIHNEDNDDYGSGDGEEMEKYRCIFYKDCSDIRKVHSGFESSQKSCQGVEASSRKAMCSITGDTKSCLSPEIAPRSLKLTLKGLKKEAVKGKKGKKQKPRIKKQ